MPLVTYDGPYAVDLNLPDSPFLTRVEPGGQVDVPEAVAAELVARAGDEWSRVSTTPPAQPEKSAAKATVKPKQEG